MSRTKSSDSDAIRPLMPSSEELALKDGQWILVDRATSSRPPADVVPAVHKAITILAFINSQGERAPLARIAEAAEVTKSHCHSILKTLAFHDWLSFDSVTKTYGLSVGILRDLSQIIREGAPLAAIKTVIEELPPKIGVSCILTEPSPDGTFVVVAKASAPGQIEVSYPIGHRLPADAPAQMKAFLAWKSSDEVRKRLRGMKLTKYTTSSITTVNGIIDSLRETRLRGYARSIEEYTEGLGAFAVPIFDSAGKIPYILNCLGLRPFMERNEDLIKSEVRDASAKIHALIGGIDLAGRS